MTSRHAAALAVLLETCSRARARHLVSRHGDPLSALARGDLDEQAPSGHKGHLRGSGRRAFARVERLLLNCRQHQVELKAHDEEGFPAALKTIPDPPMVIYLSGDPACLGLPAVAIVGARRATLVGREVASRLASGLAAAGVLVVSGLALGIDSAAHQGAVTSGRTAAVLGNGLGRVQPVTNHGLAADIVERGGVLMSEYPLRSHADKYRFPERNRLISGLSAAVVVVEAGESSGSLITARLALEQGREVLAVPGSVGHPNSAGVHRLLKQGAGLVEGVQDVLDALGHLSPELPLRATPSAGEGLSAAALELLAVMGDGSISTDELCTALSLAADRVAVLCTELELGGFVARAGAGYIRRPLM